jgi:hypothetical protein
MSTYFCLLTAVGQASIANAVALNQDVQLAEMAVGDGDGSAITPMATMTELVNEVYRIPVNTIYIDPQDAGHVIAEMVIPSNQGGWTVREVGLFDADGHLFAVGSLPESVKPATGEGAGAEMTVRMHLTMSAAQAETIDIKIDPTIVLSTRQYVDESIASHAVNVNAHPDKAGVVHSHDGYATTDHVHSEYAEDEHTHLAENITDLLTSPRSYSAVQAYTPVALPIESGIVFWDMTATPVAELVLSEDVTSMIIVNPMPGSSPVLRVSQDAAGGWAVPWPTVVYGPNISPDPTFEHDGTTGGWGVSATAPPTISGGVVDFDTGSLSTAVTKNIAAIAEEGKRVLVRVVVDSISTGSLAAITYPYATDGTTTENFSGNITTAGTHYVTVETDADSSVISLKPTTTATDAVVSEFSIYPLNSTASIKWPGGTAHEVSTDANAVDLVQFDVGSDGSLCAQGAADFKVVA